MELTTNPITHAVLTPAGTHHLISRQTNEMLETIPDGDEMYLDDGTKIRISMATIILPIAEYYKQFPEKQKANYGQPYSFGPGKGISGLIGEARAKNHKEALLRGLRKAKLGLTKTPNIDALIAHVERGTKIEDGKIKVEYNTWEEAKAAGVV